LGSISQPSSDGSYPQDTGVEVRATGRLGYGFSSWGGALAGSTTNPTTVVMDANKTISANYVPVPTYRLNVSSSNGAVTLSPPGGVYNVGAEVTLTAVPNSGFTLSSWTGDASGSSTSTTVTMTGDKSISASFIVALVTGPTRFNVNCGGTLHVNEGITFEADGARNSGGSAATYTAAITNRIDGTLYQSERWGNSFSYAIPLTNGDYRVTLMFAENHFGAANLRKFNVLLEGTQVISALDIFSNVGKNTAYNEAHITSVSDGTLNVAFTSVINNAKISAIGVERTQRPNSFTLTAVSNNGAVNVTPYKAAYDAGETVTITAIPSSGYQFSSWGGDVSGANAETTVIMNANQAVTANFTPVLTTNSSVLLVVGNIANPGTADLAIRDRLQERGNSVQLVGDSVSTTGDVAGRDLVIISSTVGSGNISTKFQSVAMPVINWETALQDEMSFTTTTDQGTESGQSSLEITLPGHPLAAGLATGVRTVSNASGGYSWGEPGGRPVVIARVNHPNRKPCLYAYEANARMLVGKAPARRVHLFLQNDTFLSLNEDGLKLFDAAVSWSLDHDDYASWIAGHELEGGPGDDDDRDGMTNYAEYVFGQDPMNGSSLNPITLPHLPAQDTMSYTRRRSALTGLDFSVWYSTTLEDGSWVKDTGAMEGLPVVIGEMETVPVTLSTPLLSHSRLFLRVHAE
ncbi:MAG: InlB B-repeat-containing protein, partial [Luteolibacter sp.]